MKDNIVYIKHIYEAIEKIERYLEGVNFKEFFEDNMRIDAVVRELEIIGEAINNISEDFRSEYQNIPWKEVVGMRNKLIHEYFGIDVNIVWQTCQKDLFELKKLIKEVLGI